ncbi:MAG TPA: ABC transporter permease subunit [Terrimicrobiaceae bacterium]|nr:ABC transporter permease subunit [Terrimicrobiaceae bacterium]
MRLFFRQLSGELRKLFARKRTFLGFGAFLAFEVVVLFLLRLEKVQGSIRRVIENAGYDAAGYLSGPTLGFLIVVWTVFLLEALFLALVAGDVVSKEVEDGSMRMMLCRPVSRGRILLLKGTVSVIYTFALTLFVAVTALAAGFANSGPGGLFVFAPLEGVFAFHDFVPGLLRYLAMVPLLALSLCTITAIAFCLSCFNMKPSTATIITLSVLFADTILKNIPYFESLRGWFITMKMTAWVRIFEYRIPWEAMVEDYMWLTAINATLFIVGWQMFEQRDFKS